MIELVEFRIAAMMVAIFAVSALPAAANEAQAPAKTLFECRIGSETVKVTAAGHGLAYRLSRSGADDLVLTERLDGGNVLYMAQRFAGMQYQLRFVAGEESHIVYSHEGNDHTDASASSGLVVMNGTERTLEAPCESHTEFDADFDYSALPEDSETYSAM